MNLDVHHCWEGSSFDWALAEYFHINCSSYTSCWLIRLQTVNSTQNHIIYTDHKYVKISNKIKNEILLNLKWIIKLIFQYTYSSYYKWRQSIIRYIASYNKYIRMHLVWRIFFILFKRASKQKLQSIIANCSSKSSRKIAYVYYTYYYHLSIILPLQYSDPHNPIREHSLHSGIEYYLCFGKLKL